MPNKDIRFIDIENKPISNTNYTITQGGILLGRGITDSNGRIKSITARISSKIPIKINLKSKQNNLNYSGDFTWSNDEPLSITLRAPGKYLLKTEKNEGEKGRYKQNYHVAKKGETLTSIAKKFDTTIQNIMLLNPSLNDENQNLEGMKIYLPRRNNESNKQRSAKTNRPIQVEKSTKKIYTIVIEGTMETKLIGSGYMYIKEDDVVISTISINAGGFGSGAPQNGNYTVSHYRNRRKGYEYHKGMNLEDVGFSFNLDPKFRTKRSLLRIHPDGNSRGTLGCIGVVGNKSELENFEATVNKILKNQKNIPTIIQIKNNPNNANPPKKIKVRE